MYKIKSKKIFFLILTSLIFIMGGCKSSIKTDIINSDNENLNQNKIVIYTSMYEEIVNSIDKHLETIFPQYDIEFVCKGTGGIQSLIMEQIENVSLGCDMLMVAEPSYSLELKEMGLLHSYKAKIDGDFSVEYDSDGYWYPVRICNMILAYNPEKYKKEELPNSFYDFANDISVKNKISMPNPLSSGTAMASISALYDKYGENYYISLKNQNVVLESASDAIKKLNSGEYKQIMILEESILKERQQSNSKLEVIYPTDGIINIPSTIMTIKEDWSANKNISACEEIGNWFLSKEGQSEIVNGWMHSILKNTTKYPYDSIPTNEIMEYVIPVNWENCFRNKRELKMKFITHINNL